MLCECYIAFHNFPQLLWQRLCRRSPRSSVIFVVTWLIVRCGRPTTAQKLLTVLWLPRVCPHVSRAGSKHYHVKGAVTLKRVWFTFGYHVYSHCALFHFTFFFTRFSGFLRNPNQAARNSFIGCSQSDKIGTKSNLIVYRLIMIHWCCIPLKFRCNVKLCPLSVIFRSYNFARWIVVANGLFLDPLCDKLK